MRRSVIYLVTAFLLISLNTAFASKDIEGAQDYPLVSRFKGSVIKWYDNKAFDKYYLLELEDNNLRPKVIEGKITRLQYTADKGHSIYEIVKSYETALKNAGFSIFLNMNEQNGPSDLNEKLYIAEFDGLNKLGAGSIKPDHDGQWAYFEAKGKSQGQEIFIVVYVTNREQPLITFDAIEIADMDAGLVTAVKIDDGIASSGHVVLDGVFFDTGKATIKHESGAALKNISSYLLKHPDRKFFIVGHTDNEGSFKLNMKLSEDRAKAVADKLISEYGVSKQQLMTYGVANLSPVSSNATGGGRAKNRRVEIVEQ